MTNSRLTVTEVERESGVSRRTINRYRENGQIKARRDSNDTRYLYAPSVVARVRKIHGSKFVSFSN